jgi:hypothetical protein
MSRVEITAGASGLHGLVLDGHDVSDGVGGLSLDVRAGRAPQVTLHLDVREFGFDGDVQVGVTASAERALIKAGWTPPSADGAEPTVGVLAEIAAERLRQNAKWGEQNHLDGTGRPGDAETAVLDRAKCKANGPDGPDVDNWRDILQEEVSEAFAETDPELLRVELIQVAAVAAQWVEAIDRRARRAEVAGDG